MRSGFVLRQHDRHDLCFVSEAFFFADWQHQHLRLHVRTRVHRATWGHMPKLPVGDIQKRRGFGELLSLFEPQLVRARKYQYRELRVQYWFRGVRQRVVFCVPSRDLQAHQQLCVYSVFRGQVFNSVGRDL